MRFLFSTLSDTKSNRRDRPVEIVAPTYTEAMLFAEATCHRRTRDRGGVYLRLVAVDGGPPEPDCEHVAAGGYVGNRFPGIPVAGYAGFSAGGGRLCPYCLTH